jgi:hypothetical protein
MSLSSIVSRIIPAVVGYATGGAPGATRAVIATEAQKKAERQQKQKFNRQQAQEQEYLNMATMDYSDFGTGRQLQPTVPTAREMGFFDRLGGIASNVGNTLLSGLESAVPSVINRAVFGSRPQSAAQGPALTTTTNVGAQESQQSGSIQAGFGSALPTILSGARSLLKSPAGQLALGGGAAVGASFFGSGPSSMRMTRKMKSQARMVLNMTGGNLGQTADILGIDQATLISLLLKRFRNDGPVVTKAALRKTKQTIRRLHSMQDVLKSITPTATMRRRTPMKRASTTTLIKN